jgi:hypothetical protein
MPNILRRAFSKPRIFQIGFNRCGTRTLEQFLLRNGIRTLHWERGEIAKNFQKRKEEGRDPFLDYRWPRRPLRKTVIAFTDMIYLDEQKVIQPHCDYEYIYEYYPSSYYILNTRDRERWVASRLKLGGGTFIDRYRKVLRASELAVIEHWRQEWDEHHHRARSFFAQRSARFLEFNIERDGGRVLSDFLRPTFGNVDSSKYGHVCSRAPTRPEIKKDQNEEDQG